LVQPLRKKFGRWFDESLRGMEWRPLNQWLVKRLNI
jgi:hypothetical protein